MRTDGRKNWFPFLPGRGPLSGDSPKCTFDSKKGVEEKNGFGRDISTEVIDISIKDAHIHSHLNLESWLR